jgi:hypothetical protein
MLESLDAEQGKLAQLLKLDGAEAILRPVENPAKAAVRQNAAFQEGGELLWPKKLHCSRFLFTFLPMHLGIDFGTTHTVVAYADRGNYPIVGFLDDEDHLHEWFPSVIAERSGELRFGFAAEASLENDGWTVQHSFKRWLSDGSDPNRERNIGSTTLPMCEWITRFLGGLREALVTRSNIRKLVKSKLAATIAVPANAHGTQRSSQSKPFAARALRCAHCSTSRQQPASSSGTAMGKRSIAGASM